MVCAHFGLIWGRTTPTCSGGWEHLSSSNDFILFIMGWTWHYSDLPLTQDNSVCTDLSSILHFQVFFFKFWWRIKNFHVVKPPKLQKSTICHEASEEQAVRAATHCVVSINKNLFSELKRLLKTFLDSYRNSNVSPPHSQCPRVFLARSEEFHLWVILPCWAHPRCQESNINGTINPSQCHITCFILVCVSIPAVTYRQARFIADTQVCYCFFTFLFTCTLTRCLKYLH